MCSFKNRFYFVPECIWGSVGYTRQWISTTNLIVGSVWNRSLRKGAKLVQNLKVLSSIVSNLSCQSTNFFYHPSYMHNKFLKFYYVLRSQIGIEIHKNYYLKRFVPKKICPLNFINIVRGKQMKCDYACNEDSAK